MNEWQNGFKKYVFDRLRTEKLVLDLVHLEKIKFLYAVDHLSHMSFIVDLIISDLFLEFFKKRYVFHFENLLADDIITIQKYYLCLNIIIKTSWRGIKSSSVANEVEIPAIKGNGASRY